MPFLQRKALLWLILLTGVLLTRIVIIRADWVESYYSSGLYPFIGKINRFLFGWLPFSIGDLFYLGAGIWLLTVIFRGIKLIWHRKFFNSGFRARLLRSLFVLLLFYVAFNFLWGLNYNRKGIAWQLDLQVKDTAASSMQNLATILRVKTNDWKPVIGGKKDFRSDRLLAIQAYTILKSRYEFLTYTPVSLKPSLFGKLGNYMGYSGYYNPFSGEAQVNTQVPGFLIPFSTCHEIAHQLGYAKENEANFVGYLAARESTDSSMRYSAYLNMFLYANGELRYMDSTAARDNFLRLSDPVKKDLAEYRKFLNSYEGPLGEFVDAFYDRYLKLNEQPAGRRTYNKVVLWLLAYYQEFGEI
jgi:Protein of unknown function (DUF3810)